MGTQSCLIKALSKEGRVGLVEHADLIKASRPYLRALSLAMGRGAHAAVLAERNGAVIDAIDWDLDVPEHAGADAIRAALNEQRYVESAGPEYACQAIPVYGTKGELVGAVGVLRKSDQTLERLHEILVCAAHGIEAEQIRHLLDLKVDSFLADSRDLQIMESLRQDIMQLHASVRLKLERAAGLVAKNETPDILRLVSGAVKLSGEFRQLAGFWLELASNEHGFAQPILLNKKLLEIRYLLETEFNTKTAKIVIEPMPTVWVRYDFRELSRQLLRSFMRVLATVKPGDEVRMSLQIVGKSAEIHLEVTGTPVKEILRLPLMARLQRKLSWAPMLPFFS